MYKKLDQTLDKYGACLLTSPHGMRYFSGFTGGEGAVLITKNGRYVIVDSRYTGIALGECADFEVIEFGKVGLLDVIKEKLSGFDTLAFEDEYMSFSAYKRYTSYLKGVEFIPYSREFEKLRMVKTPDELKKIAAAEQIGVEAFEHILSFIKPGVSENAVAAELEYFMKKRGAEKTSFDTIVVSGEKSALPHGTPSDKPIENGDFVTMDFGCVYKGYCSDMTRTVVVGKASERQREIYNIEKTAQQAGLDAIRAGTSGSEADAKARAVIDDAGYGEYFGHSLGHGVGLLIHELPNLSPRSDIALEENMVVSCEPGIYILGFGGVRIEDLVCVKENGIQNFTKLGKELIEL